MVQPLYRYTVLKSAGKLAIYHPNGTLVLPLCGDFASLPRREIIGQATAWVILYGFTLGAQADGLALWAFTCDKNHIITLQFRGDKPGIFSYPKAELDTLLKKLGTELEPWENVLEFAVRILKV